MSKQDFLSVTVEVFDEIGKLPRRGTPGQVDLELRKLLKTLERAKKGNPYPIIGEGDTTALYGLVNSLVGEIRVALAESHPDLYLGAPKGLPYDKRVKVAQEVLNKAWMNLVSRYVQKFILPKERAIQTVLRGHSSTGRAIMAREKRIIP